jgi:hypothetical protein
VTLKGFAKSEREALHGVDVRLHAWPKVAHSFPLFHQILSHGIGAIAEAGLWMKEILSKAEGR